MGKAIKSPKPMVGDDVAKLWRNVAELMAVVEAQQVLINRIEGRLPTRRKMDSDEDSSSSGIAVWI